MMDAPSTQNDFGTPYFCNLCTVACGSLIDFQSHLLGVKHRRAEKAATNELAKQELDEMKPMRTLQEQIDACKDTEPLVGLEYISRCQKPGSNVYECKLCEYTLEVMPMYMHIIGNKHRVCYLNRHHPSLRIISVVSNGNRKYRNLKELCVKVEKQFGRKNIEVLKEGESSRPVSTRKPQSNVDKEKIMDTEDPEMDFICHLCNISCGSANILQSHYLGVKHRMAEEAMTTESAEQEEPTELKPMKTLQEQIDACKDPNEPLVGLEYIYRCEIPGSNLYECKLCEYRLEVMPMFMHIIGVKHRVRYLSQHHPSLGISISCISKAKKLKNLKYLCIKVEKEFGRQKIKVLKEGESSLPENIDGLTHSRKRLSNMDIKMIVDASSSPKEPETPFFCHVCSVSCASALNLQSHFLGTKHRMVEEALRTEPKEEKPTEVKRIPTLQEQIDACQDSEPALGLEYIYQYQKGGYNTYDCKLCECQAGMATMFMHIGGAKHRQNYLHKHHPSLGISNDVIKRKPKHLKKLKDICMKVEKEFGRQKINIAEDIESYCTLDTADISPSSVYYTPDSEMAQMDFSSDDIFGNDKPAPEHAVTFLELKAIHEANQKKAAPEGGDIVQNEGTEADKDTENSVTVPAGEPRESYSGFTDHQKLLDYLERFRPLEDRDVKFVSTAVELLSLALSRHKNRSKENEPEASTEEGACETQNSAPSESPDAKKDPESLSEKELSSDSKLGKTGENPATSSESTPNVPQDAEGQHQKMGSPVPEGTGTGEIGDRKLQSKLSSTKAQAPRNQMGAAPQANRGAPPVQTRFLAPNAAAPPRVAAPLFPVAQNEAMLKFFDSIKNMEVAEVISTLNTITATNPAFKGIHVPSLIRYLGQAGKLKPAQSTQPPNP